jgi:hypothetical protein
MANVVSCWIESDVCADLNSTLRIILDLGFGDLQSSACVVETIIDAYVVLTRARVAWYWWYCGVMTSNLLCFRGCETGSARARAYRRRYWDR